MNRPEPNPSREFQLPDGRQLACGSRIDFDMLVRELFENNIYASPAITIPEGACIFDVGANIGFFVLKINQTIESGTVFAFEPISATFDLLQENTHRHNRLDLRLFNCGVSDISGTAELRFFPRMPFASTMHFEHSAEARSRDRNFVYQEIKNRGGLLGKVATRTPLWLWFPVTETVRRHYQASYKVKCETRALSDIIDEYKVERIDVLKVDTEGAEESVLAGIRDDHWPIIRQAILETHNGRSGAEKICQDLISRGFKTTVKPTMDGVEHLQMVYAVRES